MSDDLTRRIEAMIHAGLGTLVMDGTKIVGSRAAIDITSLIAEERASARREALEEAARWHDERAERTRKTLERGMSLAMRDTLDTVSYHHEQSAAAIRSLAAPEADNG